MNFTSPFYSLPSQNELKLWGFLIPLTISRYYHQQILIFTFVALEKELLETLGKGLVELFTFMYATQLGVNLGWSTIFFFLTFLFFSSTSCSGWYEEHMNEDQEDKHVKMWCYYVYICASRILYMRRKRSLTSIPLISCSLCNVLFFLFLFLFNFFEQCVMVKKTRKIWMIF